MFEEKQLTVRELVDGVIPCITAKNYSDNYVRGFRCIFNRLISYCDERNVEYFTTELAQQFVFDCYHVQPAQLKEDAQGFIVLWIFSRIISILAP